MTEGKRCGENDWSQSRAEVLATHVDAPTWLTEHVQCARNKSETWYFTQAVPFRGTDGSLEWHNVFWNARVRHFTFVAVCKHWLILLWRTFAQKSFGMVRGIQSSDIDNSGIQQGLRSCFWGCVIPFLQDPMAQFSSLNSRCVENMPLALKTDQRHCVQAFLPSFLPSFLLFLPWFCEAAKPSKDLPSDILMPPGLQEFCFTTRTLHCRVPTISTASRRSQGYRCGKYMCVGAVSSHFFFKRVGGIRRLEHP